MPYLETSVDLLYRGATVAGVDVTGSPDDTIYDLNLQDYFTHKIHTPNAGGLSSFIDHCGIVPISKFVESAANYQIAGIFSQGYLRVWTNRKSS